MENNRVKKIVKQGLYQKAPIGMMDKVMANLTINPIRKLSVKPVEPQPYFAIILATVMIFILGVGLYLKPESLVSFSIDRTINPVWVAPFIATACISWAYILVMKMQNSNM